LRAAVPHAYRRQQSPDPITYDCSISRAFTRPGRHAMQFPAGSVQALSSAASTVFSIGIVFLGYWGVHEGSHWRSVDFSVAFLALAGFACLGLVPWLATSPAKQADDESRLWLARHAFLGGVGALWLAIVVSIFT
jgi:hypothetical protein